MMYLCEADSCWTALNCGLHAYGEWRSAGARKEQRQPGTFILNWAIHLYKSKLEPLAEPFSSIKDL